MGASRARVLADLPPGLVWQGSGTQAPGRATQASGYAELDRLLPGGGWPRGAIVELLHDMPGSAELALVLPVLRRVSGARIALWVAPPCLPYAPALAAHGVDLARQVFINPPDHAGRVWATRQALSSDACEAILTWLPHADMAALRRLQLAAEASASMLFVHRPLASARQPSPAVLRLQLTPCVDGVRIDVLKRRGAALSEPLVLPLVRAVTPGSRKPHAVAGPETARTAAPGLFPRRA